MMPDLKYGKACWRLALKTTLIVKASCFKGKDTNKMYILVVIANNFYKSYKEDGCNHC